MTLNVSQNGDKNKENKIETSLFIKDYFLPLTGKFLEALRNFSILILCFAIAKQIGYGNKLSCMYYFFVVSAIISGALNFIKFIFELIDLHRGYKFNNNNLLIFFVTVVMVVCIFFVEVGTIFIFFKELWLSK